ncbi:hypothetical protein ACRALDRAFT_209399 [Sodiomyces alcalophilus JCM 7366]|uniref:uncharacterized protein n=1 Tax=Sodiomyces alcalophilus JCM 7366 TaxID=591952 RepID=UPI0039B3766F
MGDVEETREWTGCSVRCTLAVEMGDLSLFRAAYSSRRLDFSNPGEEASPTSSPDFTPNCFDSTVHSATRPHDLTVHTASTSRPPNLTNLTASSLPTIDSAVNLFCRLVRRMRCDFVPDEHIATYTRNGRRAKKDPNTEIGHVPISGSPLSHTPQWRSRIVPSHFFTSFLSSPDSSPCEPSISAVETNIVSRLSGYSRSIPVISTHVSDVGHRHLIEFSRNHTPDNAS